MGIGIGEIMVVLIIGFIVVGPEDLPKVARTLAKCVKKIRSYMKELTKSFEEEIKADEIKEAGRNIKSLTSEFERVQQDVLRHAAEVKDTIKD
ncbi:MAG: Sec-independent protein translocase protein TatB [Acidaminococcaceae bacterium]|nr:Sec-independent protein translocase protein TatB [Acidaminococcaceae bacterium]MDD4721775.1 Sec-independent protein translocase protein TatB [Acidaminococcaceae bacterium]